MKISPVIGATFSHPHLMQMGIPLSSAWAEYDRLALKWVRLGCYWEEIEKRKGTYDFSGMKGLLDACTRLNIKVVMTIGMKAPRWPEYYIPSWLADTLRLPKNGRIDTKNNVLTENLFSYMAKTIQAIRGYECIQCWQVENEPLDQSGPLNLSISEELLQEEINLVRTSDPARPIQVNVWGNELTGRGNFLRAEKYADSIGLDLYTRVPALKIFNLRTVTGPRDPDHTIRSLISAMRKRGKPVWINELQAEPWGDPGSCTPEHIIQNVKWIQDWSIDGVFLWGFEYWLQQKSKGDDSYWSAAQKAIGLLSDVKTG